VTKLGHYHGLWKQGWPGYADVLVMKASAATFMSGCWRAVALETLFVRNLADFKGGSGLFSVRQVVLFFLKIFTVFFIAEHGGLVGDMPIVADRQGMALVTSSRRRNCLPGGKHSAADTEGESRGKGNYNEFFHGLFSRVRWRHFFKQSYAESIA